MQVCKLHSLSAYEQCVPYVTLEIVKAVYIQNTPFYIIDNVYIILFDAAFAIHIYRHQENKWYYESCERVCNCKSIFQKLPEDVIPKSPKKFQSRVKPVCISNVPIPFQLNHTLSTVYSRQLLDGIALPENLYPENLSQVCPYSFGCPESNLKLEHTGINIYLENDIVQFKDHKSSSSLTRFLCLSFLCSIN